MKTKTITAGAFKTKCLAVIEEVHSKCEPVIITKRGKPVAKLIPINSRPDDIFGFMRGKTKITGDIITPVIPLEEWEND
jgi:prevent-host-death family protein